MLQSSDFVANKALDYAGWLNARRYGVTATQVAKASTAKGFEEVVEQWHGNFEIPDNPFMKFGRDSEAWISMYVKRTVGIMPNEWLIRHPEDPIALATPDGLSLRHDAISEVKTTGQDWDGDALPIQYRRQVQWQLYVSGAGYCVFAWIRRVEVDGQFVSADFQPQMVTIQRDEKMIKALRDTAQRLWAETGGGNNA